MLTKTTHAKQVLEFGFIAISNDDDFSVRLQGNVHAVSAHTTQIGDRYAVPAKRVIDGSIGHVPCQHDLPLNVTEVGRPAGDDLSIGLKGQSQTIGARSKGRSHKSRL